MENKINVAELLKDCLKGMELDCTIWNSEAKVFLKEVRNADFTYPIVVTVKDNNIEYYNSFTKYGAYNDYPYCKCVIFPKGKTTWDGFVPPVDFKDGDIVVCGESRLSEYVSIFKSNKTDNAFYYHAMYPLYSQRKTFKADDWALNINIRLATEEEKEKLFQAIKDNGYKWNPKTKTLEKLVEPKFNVGDNIRMKGTSAIYVVTEIIEDCYMLDDKDISLLFKTQDQWELVPNKFDISTLVPFESKVLVRNDESQYWIPAFWGGKREDGYVTTFGWSKYCVPYEGNEHLLDKTDDCDEYYKTWE